MLDVLVVLCVSSVRRSVGGRKVFFCLVSRSLFCTAPLPKNTPACKGVFPVDVCCKEGGNVDGGAINKTTKQQMANGEEGGVNEKRIWLVLSVLVWLLLFFCRQKNILIWC